MAEQNMKAALQDPANCEENESDMLPEQFSSPAREPHEEEARTLVAPHEEGQLAEASELQLGDTSGAADSTAAATTTVGIHDHPTSFVAESPTIPEELQQLQMDAESEENVGGVGSGLNVADASAASGGEDATTPDDDATMAKYDVLLREGKLPGRRKASSWTSMKPKPPRRARGLRQPPTLSSLAEREHGDSSSEAPEQGQEDKGEGGAGDDSSGAAPGASPV